MSENPTETGAQVQEILEGTAALAAALGGVAIVLTSIRTGYLVYVHRRRDRLADRLHSTAAEALAAATSAALLVEGVKTDGVMDKAERDAAQGRFITAMSTLQLELPPKHPVDLALDRLLL